MSKFTSKNPNLTMGTKKFVDQLAAAGGPPLYTLSYEDARKVLIDAQSGSVKAPDVDFKDMDLPVGPTGSVSTRIMMPKGASGKLPFIFYIHGGGWVLGNKETHDRLMRELCAGTGAAIVYPNYTPSPEAQYPVPTEQCYAVLEHVVKNADKYHLDPSKIIVSGDSVGGDMAAVMTLMSKERKGPKFLMQALFYPVTDANFDTESYNDFADGLWLTREAMKWFWNAYLPDEKKRGEITASPLRASTEQLKDLPPALIITDQNDVLRDEGEAYASKLVEAGVKVANVRFNGTHHDFMMLNGLADTEPTRAAIMLAISTIKHCFKHGA